MTSRIDIHAHYVGGSVARRVAGASLRAGDPAPTWSRESALAFMDRHDIAAQVLSVPGELLGGPEQHPDVSSYERYVRAINEEYAALIAGHPDRFGAFASLPLTSTEATRRELRHALDVLGLDGIALPSNDAGRYLGDPFFAPILAEAAERGVPVFVHPTEGPDIAASGLGRPSWVVELPLDTARTVTDAIFRGVLTRHPDLVMILAHCGGALPTLSWRLAEHARLRHGDFDGVGAHDDPDVGPDDVRAALARLYFDTALAGAAASVLPALTVTGADHIVFGTDWPAVPDRTVDELDAELVRLAGAGHITLEAVHRTTAASLFTRGDQFGAVA